MEWLIGIAALLAGMLLGILLRHWYGVKQITSAEHRAQGIIEEARRKGEILLEEARVTSKQEVLAQRETLENEVRTERNELKQLEKRLTKREDNLDRKVEMLDKKESQLADQEQALEQRKLQLDGRSAELDEAFAEQEKKLHAIARLSPEEARKEVLRRTEEEMDHEIHLLVEKARARAKDMADIEAQRFISIAINRLAVDTTAEHVVSTVELPSDEMKGRIIGREGRNIRAFENATGIDVIVDDTPGVVVLSGFDPVRREVAVRAMSKLVADGRIHPTRIEEVVGKTRDEVEKNVEETGKSVAMELDVRGLKPRQVMLLGRLKYRTSYGQNVLDHSREVAFLTGMMAAEMGLDETVARRCGLLHDIGKAVDHEEEGTHPDLGADVARRSGEHEDVVSAIANHHETEAADTIYATLVQAADAISASRPGARRETLEKYIKRLERLEAIAMGHEHIEKAFAIQAGRELRVIVKSNEVNDSGAARICRDIARQIEEELTYPGEVKVTMIRELRITEYAR